MTADRVTLPGSIPGLLRRGSPVVTAGASGGVVLLVAAPRPWVLLPMGTTSARAVPCDLRDLLLDLTDPTGRVHAAWWLRRWLDQDYALGDPRLHRLATADRRRARTLLQLVGEGRGDPGILRAAVLAVYRDGEAAP